MIYNPSIYNMNYFTVEILLVEKLKACKTKTFHPISQVWLYYMHPGISTTIFYYYFHFETDSVKTLD